MKSAKLKIEEKDSFKAKSNPLHHDMYHMGNCVAKRHTVVYFAVDTITGKRIKLTIKKG